jgi:hypothetical protein
MVPREAVSADRKERLRLAREVKEMAVRKNHELSLAQTAKPDNQTYSNWLMWGLGGAILVLGALWSAAHAEIREADVDPYSRFGGPTFTLADPKAPEASTTAALPGIGQDWLSEITADVALPLTPPETVQVAGPYSSATLPNRSGLPWRSGVACPENPGGSTNFPAWRNRNLDVLTIFGNRDTWSALIKYMGGVRTRDVAGEPLSIGFGLLPKDHKGRLADCAAGEFDQHFRNAAQGLINSNVANTVILRLGWEPNGPHNPWFMGATDPGPYKACFRRAVTQLKSVAPNLTIQWTPRRGSNELRYPIELGYPGDDYVDQIGLQYYDYYPVATDQTVWNNTYMFRERRSGGLKGIGTYLQFARAHGKKFALAEWGVADNYKDSGGFDNPFFIEKMLEFSKQNSSSIAYESYFNCVNASADIFQIYPESSNPRAAGRYKSILLAN